MAIQFDEDPDRVAEMLSSVLPRAQFATLAENRRRPDEDWAGPSRARCPTRPSRPIPAPAAW